MLLSRTIANKLSMILIISIITSVVVAPFSSALAMSTQLVSLKDDETQANSHSTRPSISGDGKHITFTSQGSDAISPVDSNGDWDIYLRDLEDGSTELISVSAEGTASDFGANSDSSMSDDARFVVFQSSSTNLVLNDTNGTMDVFVRDRELGSTEIVSVSSSGAMNNTYSRNAHISSDGRYVVFTSGAGSNLTEHSTNTENIYLRDRVNGTTELVTKNNLGVHGNSSSDHAMLSDDGRYIVFLTGATNLGPVDINGRQDTYLYDTLSESHRIVSLKEDGSQTDENSYSPVISGNGTRVAFHTGEGLVPEDTNNDGDVYFNDLASDSIEWVSHYEGQTVAASATNSSISQDGKMIAFNADNDFMDGDTNNHNDIIVANSATGELKVASKSTSGDFGNGASNLPVLDNTGLQVVFQSGADNLSIGDTNGYVDVFLTMFQQHDDVPPAIGSTVWAANPAMVGTNTSFNTSVTDDSSGVATGEYFIGNDPGVGNGTELTWDGTNLNSDTFGDTLEPGVYDIGIRAQDSAGNWSATHIEYLVVFDPAGPGFISGQQNVTPGEGDILPWISADEKDFATFGFNVELPETGTVDPASDFSFSYVEKGGCNNPNTPTCRSFILNTVSFNWLSIGGTASSEGIFQGTGSLEIDGIVSDVIFKVEAIDGNQLTPSTNDSFVLKIWSTGEDLQGPAHYQVSADFSPGTGNANGAIQIKN